MDTLLTDDRADFVASKAALKAETLETVVREPLAVPPQKVQNVVTC